MPASISVVRPSTDQHAGPRVQKIFVFLLVKSFVHRTWENREKRNQFARCELIKQKMKTKTKMKRTWLRVIAST